MDHEVVPTIVMVCGNVCSHTRLATGDNSPIIVVVQLYKFLNWSTSFTSYMPKLPKPIDTTAHSGALWLKCKRWNTVPRPLCVVPIVQDTAAAVGCAAAGLGAAGQLFARGGSRVHAGIPARAGRRSAAARGRRHRQGRARVTARALLAPRRCLRCCWPGMLPLTGALKQVFSNMSHLAQFHMQPVCSHRCGMMRYPICRKRPQKSSGGLHAAGPSRKHATYPACSMLWRDRAFMGQQSFEAGMVRRRTPRQLRSSCWIYAISPSPSLQPGWRLHLTAFPPPMGACRTAAQPQSRRSCCSLR